MKVNSASKPTSSTKDTVSMASASVSPGKPIITSLVNTSPGMTDRAYRISSRYFSRVYRRFISASTRSFPDWKGRWSCLAAWVHLAITSKSRGLASLGWLDMKRIQ